MIYCYALMHDALNELCQVVNKDNILIHMQNRLYAMEDTLYQYITETKE